MGHLSYVSMSLFPFAWPAMELGEGDSKKNSTERIPKRNFLTIVLSQLMVLELSLLRQGMWVGLIYTEEIASSIHFPGFLS